VASTSTVSSPAWKDSIRGMSAAPRTGAASAGESNVATHRATAWAFSAFGAA
jgi:hypothetical protein